MCDARRQEMYAAFTQMMASKGQDQAALVCYNREYFFQTLAARDPTVAFAAPPDPTLPARHINFKRSSDGPVEIA